MGDATSGPVGPVRLSFNPQLRVEFHGATVTSDAGLLLPRELGEHLGLDALIERHLTDPRTGNNRQFPLPDTAAVQDGRTPHPACPVLHPATRRKLLDSNSLSSDAPAHRATRVAPHVIESPTSDAGAMRSAGG